MKNLLNILLSITFLASIASCNQCKKLECENGGYCESGECLCEKWYSGETCGLFFNRNYAGLYEGTIDSASRSEAGSLLINADSIIPNRLVLENGVYLEFESDSTLEIPTQILALSADTLPIQGFGTFDGEILSFQYSDQYSTRSVIFSFTGVKVSFNN